MVSQIVSEGIVPGAIEMMDNLSIRAAEGATNAGYPVDAGAARWSSWTAPRPSARPASST